MFLRSQNNKVYNLNNFYIMSKNTYYTDTYGDARHVICLTLDKHGINDIVIYANTDAKQCDQVFEKICNEISRGTHLIDVNTISENVNRYYERNHNKSTVPDGEDPVEYALKNFQKFFDETSKEKE